MLFRGDFIENLISKTIDSKYEKCQDFLYKPEHLKNKDLHRPNPKALFKDYAI